MYYHLEEYQDALKFALGAGAKFDVSSKTEYVETLIAKAIDEYILIRVKASKAAASVAAAASAAADNDDSNQDGDAMDDEEEKSAPSSASASVAPAMDQRLEAIVDRMFDRCFADGEYKQALGIALETRRLDHLRTAITVSGM